MIIFEPDLEFSDIFWHVWCIRCIFLCISWFDLHAPQYWSWSAAQHQKISFLNTFPFSFTFYLHVLSLSYYNSSLRCIIDRIEYLHVWNMCTVIPKSTIFLKYSLKIFCNKIWKLTLNWLIFSHSPFIFLKGFTLVGYQKKYRYKNKLPKLVSGSFVSISITLPKLGKSCLNLTSFIFLAYKQILFFFLKTWQIFIVRNDGSKYFSDNQLVDTIEDVTNHTSVSLETVLATLIEKLYSNLFPSHFLLHNDYQFRLSLL